MDQGDTIVLGKHDQPRYRFPPYDMTATEVCGIWCRWVGRKVAPWQQELMIGAALLVAVAMLVLIGVETF